MSHSIERRIHEAIRANRGIRFSADELWQLAVADDAMATRIINAAATDAGHEVKAVMKDRPVSPAQPEETDYPQWAKDIVDAIREVGEQLRDMERRSR